MRLLGSLVVGAVIVLQAGCVTGHRTLDLSPAAAAPAGSTAPTPTAQGLVYIASVSDDRKFENKPDEPSTPSIAGDVTQMSAQDKDRMIGRQRNTFGHAMGDVMLPPGDSVTKRVRGLIEEGLRRGGYQVSSDLNAPNSMTVSINEFWAWTTPGFWALTFEAKVQCTLTVNNGSGSAHTLSVKGYGKNSGQVAKDANWQEAYKPAFEDFTSSLSQQVGQLGLRGSQASR